MKRSLLWMLGAALWFVTVTLSHGWWHWTAIGAMCLYLVIAGEAIHGRRTP